MFTSESLHSEFEHRDVEVEMVVVVECYCFLINIIVDARRRATPQKPMRFCYFQQKCVHSSHKTMSRRNGSFLLWLVFDECFTLSACWPFANSLIILQKV